MAKYYGSDFEIEITPAMAKKICDNLPAMGESVVIAMSVNESWRHAMQHHELSLLNISGDYLIACYSVPVESWTSIFNIAPRDYAPGWGIDDFGPLFQVELHYRGNEAGKYPLAHRSYLSHKDRMEWAYRTAKKHMTDMLAKRGACGFNDLIAAYVIDDRGQRI